jgi:hypothetical protein
MDANGFPTLAEASDYARDGAIATERTGESPVLKGTYDFIEVINCVQAQGIFFQDRGSLSLSPNTGTFRFNAYAAEGDPLKLDHIKQSGTYSNSGTTVTFDTTTYQATYGKLERESQRTSPLSLPGADALLRYRCRGNRVFMRLH